MVKRKDVLMGFSVEDVAENWKFVDVVDYGEFGAGSCHIGHPIRYGHIVENPKTGEQHVYGSQCICKFWIFQQFKDIDPSKFKELYKQYHKLFVKLGKLIYQATTRGISIPKFPQTFDELESVVDELKQRIKEFIKQKRAEFKKAMKQYEKSEVLRIKRKRFTNKYPEMKILMSFQDNLTVLQPSQFLMSFAQDFISKFATWGEVQWGELTEKQYAMLKKVTEILQGKRPLFDNGNGNGNGNGNKQGNPELIRKLKELQSNVYNSWIRDTFIPSLIKQLEYKTDLSEKQWEVFGRNGIDVSELRKNDNSTTKPE